MSLFVSVFSRLVAAALSLAILGTATFFIQQYYADRYVLNALNPDAAGAISGELLTVLFVLGIVSAFLFSLLIYVLLSVRVAATTIAHNMTSDLVYSREQFKRFYDMSPVPYVLINKAGLVDRPNKAAVRFFGMKGEELTGENLFAFLSTPDKPEKAGLVKARFERRIPIDQELMMARKRSGEERWVMLSVGDITTPGSSVHTGLVTIVDVHEQKELERIKTEFLSLASHQLRAPLANIKWYIDFLLHRRTEELTDSVREYLARMNDRNEDMIDLVNTLLNMSRIELGRVKVEKEQVDIEKLIHGVEEELKPEAERKHISLTANIPAGITTNTDPRLVRIIVQNLLSNALRYTPEGGSASIAVAQNGKDISVAVSDTGIGIPPDEQGKIFSKLYRASNAKKVEVNGNGIGLYMCKALSESLGGSLAFTTELNKGTTFTLTIPLV